MKPGTLPTSAGTYATILSGLYSSSLDGFEFGINNSGKLYFQLNGNNYANTTGPALTNGTCSHVAITRSGSTFTFYVDGTATGTFTDANSPTYTEADYLVGQTNYTGGSSNGQYNGLIEDLRIWNVARTQSQISSNRFVTLTGTESGLLGYWPINEGSGTVLNNYASDFNDGYVDGQTWTTLSCGGSRISNVEESSSTTNASVSHSVEAFPVPFDTDFTVNIKEDKPLRITVLNMTGQTMEEVKGNASSAYRLGAHLPSGLYLVIVELPIIQNI